MQDAGYGLCRCGCGERTQLAKMTNGRRGWVKGEPVHYVLGHVAYEMHRGPVPSGLELDHLCRVPACVNPDHLEPVSHAENVRRSHPARGERHGNCKLTAEAVRHIRALLAEGVTQAAIAPEFGVAQTTISAIAHGVTWRHVV